MSTSVEFLQGTLDCVNLHFGASQSIISKSYKVVVLLPNTVSMKIVVDDKCNTLKHDRDSSWAECNSVEARLVKKNHGKIDGDILSVKRVLRSFPVNQCIIFLTYPTPKFKRRSG